MRQVLYWHWGETTATFKATVQYSFQQYGEQQAGSTVSLCGSPTASLMQGDAGQAFVGWYCDLNMGRQGCLAGASVKFFSLYKNAASASMQDAAARPSF